MTRGIGPVLGRQLIGRLLAPSEQIQSLWSKSASELATIEGVGARLVSALQATQLDQVEILADECRQQGIKLLCPDDPLWPESFKSLEDAPLILFVRGDASALNAKPMLSVVGARRATQQGRALTRRWCTYLSNRGVSIVSGMAFGIDAAAHRGALEGDSPTIAVLGCGLSSLSDEQSAQVDAIAAQGCVISEFVPSQTARPEHFPRRNRIIASLSEATLVMEADVKSGSLITAHQAAEYGREVLAVPGSVLSGNHAGCHLLIREGAALIESADALLYQMGWGSGASDRNQSKKTYHPASEKEALILAAMAVEIMHVDALAESCGLTVPELSPILLALELQGVIERLPGSRYLLAVELEKK